MPNIIQFSYARGALIGAINSIITHYKIKNEITVWLPAFICDTVIYLLEAYNIKVSYYPITNSLEPNWNKLNYLAFSEGDIFLLVHYFGFQMPTHTAIEFCKTNKLHMIEDCAHSIVPSIENESIGTHGDAAIFGLRKALPVPHGGFLYMQGIKYVPPKSVSLVGGIYRSPLKMIIQWVFIKLKIKYPRNNKLIKKGVVPTFPANYSLFNFQEEMNTISRKITNSVNIFNIVTKRINNYLYYEKSLSGIKNIMIPISFKIKRGQTTPWVFFFFHKEAERLINYLLKNGIPASDFPTLHPNILRNPDFDFENKLYDQSVTLPVHQDMTLENMDYIIKILKEFDEILY